jgi:hypothetical protein
MEGRERERDTHVRALQQRGIRACCSASFSRPSRWGPWLRLSSRSSPTAPSRPSPEPFCLRLTSRSFARHARHAPPPPHRSDRTPSRPLVSDILSRATPFLLPRLDRGSQPFPSIPSVTGLENSPRRARTLLPLLKKRGRITEDLSIQHQKPMTGFQGPFQDRTMRRIPGQCTHLVAQALGQAPQRVLGRRVRCVTHEAFQTEGRRGGGGGLVGGYGHMCACAARSKTSGGGRGGEARGVPNEAFAKRGAEGWGGRGIGARTRHGAFAGEYGRGRGGEARGVEPAEDEQSTAHEWASSVDPPR